MSKTKKSKKAKTFVIYSGPDEMLVMTPDKEFGVVTTYFDNTGRDIDDYDRIESTDTAILVQSNRLRLK